MPTLTTHQPTTAVAVPKQRRARKLDATVLDLPLAAALAEGAVPLWDQAGLYPALGCQRALQRAEQLVAVARAEGIATIGQLLTGTVTLLQSRHRTGTAQSLASLAAGSITVGAALQTRGLDTLDALHHDRNLLLGLALASALALEVDPRPLAAAWTQLPSRTDYSDRASRDDEIVLCRSVLRHLAGLADIESATRAAAGTLLDAGLSPAQAAQATDSDLDDFHRPTRLEVTGTIRGSVHSIRARQIELDPFCRAVLKRTVRTKALARVDTGGWQGHALTYTSAQGVEGASDKIKTSQSRLHVLLGFGSDLTASGPAHWRYESVRRGQGDQAALDASGLPTVSRLDHKLRVLPNNAHRQTPSIRRL